MPYVNRLSAKAGHWDTCIPIVDDKVKEQIMSALRDRDQGKNIIGLCGQDKRINHSIDTIIRREDIEQLFKEIVFATMTKKPYITNIQTLGTTIGLNFDDMTNLAETTCFMCFGNNKRMRTA